MGHYFFVKFCSNCGYKLIKGYEYPDNKVLQCACCGIKFNITSS